jgi:hypothetical protein
MKRQGKPCGGSRAVGTLCRSKTSSRQASLASLTLRSHAMDLRCLERERLLRWWTDCSNRLMRLQGEEFAAMRTLWDRTEAQAGSTATGSSRTSQAETWGTRSPSGTYDGTRNPRRRDRVRRATTTIIPVPLMHHGIDRGVHRPIPPRVRLLRPNCAVVAQALDSNLQAAGIRSMVTSRAKSPARLEAKVRQRARTIAKR